MEQVMLAPAEGLTGAEAEVRRRRGEGNAAVQGGSRSYGEILRTNVFSFFNLILFVIGAALLALERYSDALVSVGLGLINAVISAAQEIRAKRKLDRLQLLDRAGVMVIRDGQELEISPELVVRGDVLRVRPGDQIVVDGPLLDGGRLEADESLLTGESDPVVKHPGDELRSGSLCVAGGGHQQARDVGAHSYAGRLTAEARRSTTDKTPLQRRIEFIVRLVMVLAALMSGAILAQAAIEGFSVLRVVQITAVLSGLVPYGLFFLIALAYTAGAVRIARHGALVQQVNAVESVSNVDVVCTDKTGTLTTGQLSLEEIVPIGEHEYAEVATALGSLAHNATTPNLTALALVAALPGDVWEVRDEVPFSSSLRWSGLVTDEGTWVLGAPDALAPRLRQPFPATEVTERTGLGLRVLLLARAEKDTTGLRDAEGHPELPMLAPVALVALADELRDEVVETVRRFADEGVSLKVLSGDDPRTVAAIARRAGIDADEPVPGAALDDLDDPALDAVVARTAVFGRVAPEHKERIVRSLRRQGHYVAMIGDGVNDARALKQAHIGVAMRSGSAVTKDVADIVLVEDSFAALPPAQLEGRKIINGIGISLYVFLARVVSQGLVILTVTMLGLGFPYSPTQVGLTMFTVGVPTVFLTFWAKPTRPDPFMLRNLVRFVLPASIVTATFGAAVYTALYEIVVAGFSSGRRTPHQIIDEFESYTGLTYGIDADFTTAAATILAQTGLSTFFCFASFGLILFLAPRSRFFAAWTTPTKDTRPALLVLGLCIVFSAVLFIPFLWQYFGLTGPSRPVFLVVVPALLFWYGTLTVVLRYRVFDRLLGLEVH
ncbi:putative integral membrane ATPase [Actinoplanes missouriensis 431]|uniref:Putative integral membrane ATPase n=1 Tax=Actinoplanes missouriensis (strain ATCC 14538 / DSM 43046 / CBS 188.64 / JCM 3121 / NBRC 102363 / NCIMB 12654 / NRRL B-3342 / UNCC 431) TaxID=512565 RepID=I0H212_ACTM4|nr:HAD-IC family P-type ATPase [Actinoplanes missouriensis]BAL87049.1 putative integral membrane ATPase [Actinoplanes missouriensis 431]